MFFGSVSRKSANFFSRWVTSTIRERVERVVLIEIMVRHLMSVLRYINPLCWDGEVGIQCLLLWCRSVSRLFERYGNRVLAQSYMIVFTVELLDFTDKTARNGKTGLSIPRVNLTVEGIFHMALIWTAMLGMTVNLVIVLPMNHWTQPPSIWIG